MKIEQPDEKARSALEAEWLTRAFPSTYNDACDVRRQVREHATAVSRALGIEGYEPVTTAKPAVLEPDMTWTLVAFGGIMAMWSWFAGAFFDRTSEVRDRGHVGPGGWWRPGPAPRGGGA